MTSKNKKKSKNQKTKIFKNESYQFTLVNPKKLLRPHPDPKNISIGPQKAQKDLKKQKIKKIKNQKTKIFKNESYQFKLVNPKKLLRPHLDPKKYLDRAPKD